MNSATQNTVVFEDAIVIRETAAAYYVTTSGLGLADSVWLAKSQLSDVRVTEESYDDGCKPTRFLSAAVPAWLFRNLKRDHGRLGPIPQATRAW